MINKDDNNKRLALALILSIFVFFVYTESNRANLTPQSVPLAKQQIVQNNKTNENTLFQAPTQPEAQELTLQDFSKGEKTIVKTGLAEIEISHQGARLTSFKLPKFTQDVKQKRKINLIDKKNKLPPLGVYIEGVNDENTVYQLSSYSSDVKNVGNTFELTAHQSLVLTFKGLLPNGVEITKELRFSSENYYFNVDVTLSSAIANSNIWLEWTNFVAENNEQQSWNPFNYTILTASEVDDIIPLANIKENFTTYEAKWSVFGDNYFVNAIIPTISGQNTMIAAQHENGLGTITFSRSAGGKTEAHYDMYAGPKSVEALKAKTYKLEKSIDLGIFAIIGQPIAISLELLYELIGNYGLAIILLTIIIKLLLFPLNNKSLKSMRAMQELKPEMDELRAKIKDPTQLNQAVMAMYKRKGVNPMGGCLPMIIQIPVFLGMYNALRTSFYLRQQPFALWIDDLSAPEAFPLFGFNIPVMILLMSASMLIQQYTTPSSATMDPAQKKAMMLTPIIFTVMFLVWPFPSGLVLYWLINNLTSICQQYGLRDKTKISPFQAMVIGSIAIFGFSVVLTLI